MNKRILFTTLSILGTTTIITPISVLLSSCAKLNYSNVQVGNFGINENIVNKQYDEDAYIKNINSRSNDDSVIHIVLNWVSVITTYSAVTQILKMLELNPEKEIHFHASKAVYHTRRKWDFSVLENQSGIGKKYPNLHFHWLDEAPIRVTDNFYLPYTDSILTNINKEKENVMYIADINFINWIAGDTNNMLNNVNHHTINNLFTTYYLVIKQMNEINIITDGTLSTDFYSNKFYDYFKVGGELFRFDENTNSYPNLIDLQLDIKQMNDAEFLVWLKQNHSNPWTYLFSVLAAGKKPQNQQITKLNYFLPAANLVKDVNNHSSTQFNNNVQFDEYFDPYDSNGLNFIKFMQSLSEESKQMLFTITKTKAIDQEFFTQFENHTNFIYGGLNMMNNANLIRQEARRLIKLLKLGKAKYPNEAVQIWFKGHPNDHTDSSKLINEIKKLVNNDNEISDKTNFVTRIKILDKNIPLEMYGASGLFANEPAKNKKVKLYATFSSYTLSVLAFDKEMIEKIIVSDDNIKQINFRFGNVNESLCFPKELIIHQNDLFD